MFAQIKSLKKLVPKRKTGSMEEEIRKKNHLYSDHERFFFFLPDGLGVTV
jgi:hypothetical protein